MCLEKISVKKIAKTDIIVYKHVKYVKCAGGKKFITPYNRSDVVMDEILHSALDNSTLSIHSGFHSFKLKEDCIYDAIDEGSGFVVECIIPKGSSYYEGDFLGSDAYASDSIMYNSSKMTNV